MERNWVRRSRPDLFRHLARINGGIAFHPSISRPLRARRSRAVPRSTCRKRFVPMASRPRRSREGKRTRRGKGKKRIYKERKRERERVGALPGKNEEGGGKRRHEAGTEREGGRGKSDPPNNHGNNSQEWNTCQIKGLRTKVPRCAQIVSEALVV